MPTADRRTAKLRRALNALEDAIATIAEEADAVGGELGEMILTEVPDLAEGAVRMWRYAGRPAEAEG